ncbi:MAG: tetratricopeptide repeat protein [bacterium]|nr:tetratricopeptide repeat protein [bacterium]
MTSVHAKMLVLAVLLGTAITGCAPQLDRIEVAVQDNHDEMSVMKAENKRLLQEVEALAELLRMESTVGDETSAMRMSRLSQLSSKMDQLMNKLDDNSEYMRDLSARVDLLATRSGLPTLGEYKVPTKEAAKSVLVEEGQAIYDMAVLDRDQGNVTLARQGFTEFLKQYPTSEISDDALYWLGDLAYGEKEYEEALGYFQKLLEQYPRAEFAPAAMFKSRTCFLELNRQDDAWEMGGQLLGQFPDSPEAALLIEESGQ